MTPPQQGIADCERAWGLALGRLCFVRIITNEDRVIATPSCFTNVISEYDPTQTLSIQVERVSFS